MTKDYLLKLGYKIKYERKKRNLSQMELALRAELTAKSLSKIECGLVDLRLSSLFKLAQALDMNITELLDLPF